MSDGRGQRGEARPPRSWPRSLVATGLALWTPFLVAALFDERVRRGFADVWFWPGLLPASQVFDDLYTPWAALFAGAYLVLWSAIHRRRRWAGLFGALVCGFLSLGQLMALLSI